MPSARDASRRVPEQPQPSRGAPAERALALQRASGNRAAARLLQRTITVGTVTYGPKDRPLAELIAALGNPKGAGTLLSKWWKSSDPHVYATPGALLTHLEELKTGGAAAEVLGADREGSAAAHIGGVVARGSGRDPDLRSADGKRSLKVDVFKASGEVGLAGNVLKLGPNSVFEVIGIVGGKSKDTNPANFKRICDDLAELCDEYEARPIVFAAANTGEATLETAVKAVGMRNVLVEAADGRWVEWASQDKGWREGESAVPEGGVFEMDM
jgi:hypothetical protein